MAFLDWLRKVLEIGPKNEPAPDNTSDPIPHPDRQAIASSSIGNQGVRQDPKKRQRFIDLFHEGWTYGNIGDVLEYRRAALSRSHAGFRRTVN